jgi:hypothetical protein
MRGVSLLVKRTSDNYQGKSGNNNDDEDEDKEEEIFSSRRHLMDYVTVDGIIKRTGYTDKKDWYLLVIKELFDNAIDWLWNEYPGSADSKITARITIDNKFFNCKIRNTNPKNIPIFTQLQNIFNYEMTYGSKQNEFKISRGTLGDAMKYIAALPYVLTNLGRDKSNDFQDRQWEIPLYVRHNKFEQQVLIVVDEANSTIDAYITPLSQAKAIKHTDTEIEVTYPIIDEVREAATYEDTGELMHGSLDFDTVAQYCKQQKVGTTDISFEIEIVDKRQKPSSSPRTERITQQAAHAISQQWTNIPSIKAYTPQEFRKKIFGVHDKNNTTIYKVLRTFREGTQLKKRADLDVPVSQLTNNPDKIKELYYELRNNSRLSKNAPKKISLPYSHIVSSNNNSSNDGDEEEEEEEDD